MTGVEEVRPVFKAMVEAAMWDQASDNPIYRVRQAGVMREIAINSSERYIVDQLETIQQQLSRLTIRRPSLDTLSRLSPRYRPRCRVDVDVQGTREQIDQFLETASEKGYKVDGVQPGLLDPSIWRLVFDDIDLIRLEDELPQDVMEAGLTLLNIQRHFPTRP